jgi:hypothetical protein
MEILPVVFVGALILVFGVRLVVQGIVLRSAEATTSEDYLRGERVLDSVFIEADIMKRILSSDDANFVANQGTYEVRRLFYSERKKLAIRWVRRTQKHMSDLLKLHLMLSSYTSKPIHQFDFDLSAKYMAFKVISNFVLGVIWLVGPFKAAIVVTHTLDSASYFWNVFRLRHVDVKGSRLSAGPQSL